MRCLYRATQTCSDAHQAAGCHAKSTRPHGCEEAKPAGWNVPASLSLNLADVYMNSLCRGIFVEIPSSNAIYPSTQLVSHHPQWPNTSCPWWHSFLLYCKPQSFRSLLTVLWKIRKPIPTPSTLAARLKSMASPSRFQRTCSSNFPLPGSA